MRAVGFEYQSKRGSTPFEVFLRYSDEKERSSAVLGRLLKKFLRRTGVSLLDVGAGNGEFLRLALSRVSITRPAELTLLEPSPSLVRRLREAARGLPPKLAVTVKRSALEEYNPRRKFDVILASHLPFPKYKLPSVYSRLLSWLSPGGSLIVVLRQRDDIHLFRTTFKSQLIGARTQSLTMDDALYVLKRLPVAASLHTSSFQARATLSIPFRTNPSHTKTIVEFLLNRRWRDFPENVRQNVLQHLRKKQGKLQICEGFLVVKVSRRGSSPFK